MRTAIIIKYLKIDTAAPLPPPPHYYIFQKRTTTTATATETTTKQLEHQVEMSSREFINSLINTNKIVIFSKSYCSYCGSVKQLFNKLNEPYKSVELDELSNGAEIQRELYEMTGQSTVPSVWINKKFIGGNSETQALYRKGQLRPLLDSKF